MKSGMMKLKGFLYEEMENEKEQATEEGVWMDGEY